MRIFTAIIGFLVVLSLGSGLQAQTTPDEALFRDAKLLVYDKSWNAALEKLAELREKYPDSPYAGQALFYKGECLSGLRRPGEGRPAGLQGLYPASRRQGQPHRGIRGFDRRPGFRSL